MVNPDTAAPLHHGELPLPTSALDVIENVGFGMAPPRLPHSTEIGN
jgi:hypothetical protein